MRKLFTIDDLFIALVAAVGYGFSFEVPKIFGCPEWLSIVSCLVVGTTLEGLLYKIIFNKTVQEKSAYRFTAFAVFIAIFLSPEKSPRRWACPCSITSSSNSNSSSSRRFWFSRLT